MKYKYLVWCGGLALAIAAGFMSFRVMVQAADPDTGYLPPPNYAEKPPPEQPVPFSHARHAGELNLSCQTCHVGAGPQGRDDPRTEGGKHMTLPEAAICMDCHRSVAADSPAVQRLAEFQDMEKAVPWKRVYRVLEGVNWSHEPHLQADIKCQICHSEVEQMEVMTMTTAVTAMSTCLSCHRAYQADSECETCHAWPAGEHFHQWDD